MRKILFCDIDGTIIDGAAAGRAHLISLADWKALRKIRETGNLLVLCTARDRLETQAVLRRFKLPYDYLILNNGARIEDRLGAELYSRTLPQAEGLAILDYCVRLSGYSVYFYDYGRDMGFSDLYPDAFLEEAKKSASFDLIELRPLEKQAGFSAMVGTGKNLSRTFGKTIRVSLNPLSLAVTPGGQTKGSAMERLLSMFQEHLEVYSIGDSTNDSEMFVRSDRSFTFPRCESWVRNSADLCVDYVYEAVERILA